MANTSTVPYSTVCACRVSQTNQVILMLFCAKLEPVNSIRYLKTHILMRYNLRSLATELTHSKVVAGSIFAENDVS